MLHTALFPYLNSFGLGGFHSECHARAIAWSALYRLNSLDQAFNAGTNDSMRPTALLIFHNLLVEEMRIRGHLTHLDPLEETPDFDRVLKADRATDLLCDVMPQNNTSFLISSTILYRNQLFNGGRLPAKPEVLVDSVTWANGVLRSAALIFLEQEWKLCGSPY